MRFMLSCSAAQLSCSAAQLLSSSTVYVVVFIGAKAQEPPGPAYDTPLTRLGEAGIYEGKWPYLPSLPCSCYRPAAGAILHGLCCRGYAAGATLQGLCCRGSAAGATLQGLCCRGYAAGAMLQGLCCRGSAAIKVVGAQGGSLLNYQ